MKNLKNIINTSSFIILISFLCCINRFIYHYLKPENKMELTFCTNLHCKILWEPTLFSVCLLIFILTMIYTYFIYNPRTKSFSETKTIKSYNIEKIEHSSMLWGVICYPLILCPLAEDLFLFFSTLITILVFTGIYLRHLSEVVLPPLVIISGEKLYILKNANEFFYLLTSKNETELQNIKNIKCKQITENIYKEIV